MDIIRREQRLGLPELDKTNLNKTVNTSPRTVKERRLGLSESDQSAKFKKSARVRTRAINCDGANFRKMVQEFTGIPSPSGTPTSGEGSYRDDGSTPRKREVNQRWTELVRVNPASGLEGAPEDGYSWRKDGQNDILGSKYPREYYRCMHRKVNGCLAKKQVQRSDDEPTVFEIMYDGKHTCNHHPAALVPPSPLPENQTDSNASTNAAPLQIRGAEGRTVFCKAHGRGRRCEFLGCAKSAEGHMDFCIAHGGGRRCSHEGCTRAARGKSGLCIRHGGGKRCQKSGCTKSAEGHSGLCISHGGGRRCQFIGCTKGAQGSTLFCKAHGGGKRCTLSGCNRVIIPNLNSNNDSHNLSSPVFDFPPNLDNTFGLGSNFSSTPHFLSLATPGTNRLSVSPEPKLAMIGSAGTSGYNSLATRRQGRLSEVKVVYRGSKSDDNEQLLLEEKSISDLPFTSSVESSISLGSGLCPRSAEDQKEGKPFFGIDLLLTKAGCVTKEESWLSDLKEEENATVSSEAEKLEAMQKQRAESDLVSMENTRDRETELFPWLVKKDADPHAALEEVHSYSSYSELELGSHCSESESQDTDKKMKIEASPEYHERETSESVVLHMQNTVEPEVEPFSLEVNKDTASEEVHSYSSEQESEVDSYCSGPEYEDGDKKARTEASPAYNDIMHIPKMRKESSPQATLDSTDASIGMLGGGGKQDGRPSEGWSAINYDSVVDHLIKSIKNPNLGKIGIYGRNEVGKAFVIEALRESAVLRNLFDRVICVTVPLNCDMEKVQKEIAGQICYDLTEANAVDMPHSVVNALEGLKFLLILVGINQHMKLETLRIPDSTPPVGSKIVFVAGSGQVCDEIEVDEKISLDYLLLWELFCQNVGEVLYRPKKVLAEQIVRMCRSCSHAVILVARALQNVDDLLIWKRVLMSLTVRPASHEAHIEALMVNVLRFSIDQLEDDKTRRCLKNLAHWNNYPEIASESAIGLWVRDGIVDDHDEGQKVLKNLVNANLLEVDENGQSVKFQDQDQNILVNLIFQPKENRMFLMRGGLDLTEPPEVEEWESAKEICLMHTGISELPQEPRCPSLSSLYLQRNYKLRRLSSSFFNQMPALEVLNLSRTRIRCLPESISQLVSLKRLFLNDCVLLRSISPAIGRLKQLEVFDLEGTKIINLPKEIECLTNLTSLGISITGTEPSDDSKTVIPHGVISSLLHLEELNLDVDADAKWWDTCAERVVSEVCNLKRLTTIKFFFPTLELLRQFNQLRKSMGHPSLAQFRFLVGNHANRIMNRLPSDIEFELEWCERYLRYINGDGVLTDIKDILPQSDALFLERHANAKTLSELGINSMEQLKWCVLGECNELEVLIDASDTMHQEAMTESHCKSICLESLEFLYVYYMRNLRYIWKGSVQRGCLSSLKLLTLHKCPELTVIFSYEMLNNLYNLEEVTIEDCPAIKSLISCETSAGEVREMSHFLPMLKKLSLHYVPQLSSISCGLPIAPRLERLSFYDCPSLKSLSTDEVSSEHLKKIRGERSWWKDLEWRGHKPEHLDGIFAPIDTCDVP
ncbi:uncharacterized protein LOC115726293 [Rhodamnia argentea]|uniref:Uncharacterized protein LOC115726293 n=1 Tax=Rhodamnia argentea TaxID=178133 RepID=A0ABM3HDB4_9MYRT|nr:uncharacterized protein LOC115726293 [Rhodamnia argentea]